MNTAQIILNQLGGNKFSTMTGACNFGTLGNNLSFKIKGCKKYNYVDIVLNEKDLYDVEFIKIRNYERVRVDYECDLYADQLCTVFEKNTGLYTRL